MSAFVAMKKDSSTVGGYTHLRDFGNKAEADKFANGANGMTVTIWTRKQYEDWYRANISEYHGR